MESQRMRIQPLIGMLKEMKATATAVARQSISCGMLPTEESTRRSECTTDVLI